MTEPKPDVEIRMFDRPNSRSPQQNHGTGPNGTGPKRRLAVMQLVRVSLQSLMLCRDDALRLGIVPLVIYFLGSLYGAPAFEQMFTGGLEDGSAQLNPGAAGPLMVTAIIIVIGLSLLSVNWLRFLLLGPSAVEELGLALRRLHVIFLLGALALGFCGSIVLALVSIPIALLLGAAAQIGVLVAALLIGVVGVRLALVLVAIAIGQPISLRQAWDASQGQGWILLLACLLVEAPFLLLMIVIRLIAEGTGLADAAPYTMLLIGCLAQIAATLAQCGVVAAGYRRLVGVRV